MITEKKFKKNLYKNYIYNVDIIKINEKSFLIKNNNPLREEILTFLKNKDYDFKKNKIVSLKTQKLLDIVSYKK